MSFLIFGDAHLSDKPPSRRSETYTEDILAKLAWLVEQAEQKQVAAIVGLGDLLHIKAPSRTSHRLVQRIHEVLTKYDRPVILTVGNHDVVNDRLDSLDSQPLGALGRMEGIEVLVGKHETLPIFSIPYLQDWQTLPAWVDQYRAARDKDNAVWLLTMHAPIFPDHEDPPYDYIHGSTMAKMVGPDDPTWLAYGHIHDPHGVYKPTDCPTWLANLGAISRGSLHIETLKRKPQAYIWDPNTNDHEVLDIPHKKVEEIFPLQEVNAEKAKVAGMTAFLEGVSASAVDATDTDAVMAAAREANLGSEVEEVVLSLLTSDE